MKCQIPRKHAKFDCVIIKNLCGFGFEYVYLHTVEENERCRGIHFFYHHHFFRDFLEIDFFLYRFACYISLSYFLSFQLVFAAIHTRPHFCTLFIFLLILLPAKWWYAGGHFVQSLISSLCGFSAHFYLLATVNENRKHKSRREIKLSLKAIEQISFHFHRAIQSKMEMFSYLLTHFNSDITPVSIFSVIVGLRRPHRKQFFFITAQLSKLWRD